MLEAQRKIRSFYVVYVSERGEPSEPGGLAGDYVHRVVAAKAPDRMYYASAHGMEGLDWQDYPERQHWYLAGERLFNERPLNRVFTAEGPLRPEDQLPRVMAEEIFGFSTGLWLIERRPLRWEGLPIALREVAASPAYSTVRARQELADGRWCHVLENERGERLWIDTEHGCALLTRETDYGTPPVLMQRLETGGHREVAPGVWLPSRMRNVQYNWQGRTETERKRKVVDTRFRVLEARANDVDDSLFEFRPPPGALDLSRPKEPVQTEPGGLDHLDNLAAWVRAHRSAVSLGPEVEAYLTGLPLLGLIVAYEFWRRWRRNRAAPVGEKHHDLQTRAVP
jgi:hypothetical protein